jgi:hypothetical protein
MPLGPLAGGFATPIPLPDSGLLACPTTQGVFVAGPAAGPFFVFNSTTCGVHL